MSDTEEPEAATDENDSVAPAPVVPAPVAPAPVADVTETRAPRGIRRVDQESVEIVDAMAGRASVFGFGFEPLTEAIRSSAQRYLGDGSVTGDPGGTDDDAFLSGLGNLLGDAPAVPTDSVFLCPAADIAVETAIALARKWRPEKSFRTVAMLGSDHGRTAMCRTASGRPELHEGFGPMMAGFAHVPVGDLDAVRAVIDEQTACLLLSPIDLRRAAMPCDADYLKGLRAICDERDILLIMDETQIVLGSSGRLFAHTALAEIQADMVVFSSGLFAGLAGGVVLATERVTGRKIINVGRYPLLAAVASQTFASMAKLGLPESANDSMREFAVKLAEQVGGFEFIRDVNASGMTFGIETDIESSEVVRAGRRQGMRLEPAGDTAVRLQPPLVMADGDQQALLARLGETMKEIERNTATAEIGVGPETA